LTVPGGAQPGRYLSDIVATGSAVVSVGRANLGVAAATRLGFSVAPGPPPGVWPFGAAWVGWAAIGLLVAAVGVTGARRSGVRIRVERTPSDVARAAAGRGTRHDTRATRATRRGAWLRPAIALAAAAGLAACSTSSGTPAGTPGKGSSIAISL